MSGARLVGHPDAQREELRPLLPSDRSKLGRKNERVPVQPADVCQRWQGRFLLQEAMEPSGVDIVPTEVDPLDQLTSGRILEKESPKFPPTRTVSVVDGNRTIQSIQGFVLIQRGEGGGGGSEQLRTGGDEAWRDPPPMLERPC